MMNQRKFQTTLAAPQFSFASKVYFANELSDYGVKSGRTQSEFENIQIPPGAALHVLQAFLESHPLASAGRMRGVTFGVAAAGCDEFRMQATGCVESVDARGARRTELLDTGAWVLQRPGTEYGDILAIHYATLCLQNCVKSECLTKCHLAQDEDTVNLFPLPHVVPFAKLAPAGFGCCCRSSPTMAGSAFGWAFARQMPRSRALCQ